MERIILWVLIAGIVGCVVGMIIQYRQGLRFEEEHSKIFSRDGVDWKLVHTTTDCGIPCYEIRRQIGKKWKCVFYKEIRTLGRYKNAEALFEALYKKMRDLEEERRQEEIRMANFWK